MTESGTTFIGGLKAPGPGRTACMLSGCVVACAFMSLIAASTTTSLAASGVALATLAFGVFALIATYRLAGAAPDIIETVIAENESEVRHATDALAREDERRKRLKDIITAFDTDFLETLDETVGNIRQLRATAISLAQIADRSNEEVTAVAATSEQSSRSIADVAAATDQLASSIGVIDRQLLTTQQLVATMNDGAKATRETVDQLDQSVQRIDGIVGLIRGIAEQTNLLALNATIEAARAGDAGRGFAVVAAEVKALSQQTATATQDITAQIAAIKQATAHAVTNIRDLSGGMVQLDERTLGIAAALEEQGQMTHVISQSIGEIATGMAHLAEATCTIRDSAARTHEAADTALGSSATLECRATRLETSVHQFMQRVASA